MIRITRSISLDESEITESFIHASGPGGQNVNKVATAVQLRFDVAHSPSLPDDVRERLTKLAGSRMTEDGELVIDARRYRSQFKNREDALQRLVELIRRAAVRPRKRRPTKPSQAAKQRRLDSKKRHAEVKRARRPVRRPED